MHVRRGDLGRRETRRSSFVEPREGYLRAAAAPYQTIARQEKCEKANSHRMKTVP
jgi:hypothetical protein